MGSLKRFRTDTEKEDNGVEFEFGDGVFVTIRSDQAKRVREWALARLKKQRSIYMSGNVLSVKQIDQDEVDKCAEVVVSWRGVTEDDEVTPISATAEHVRRVAAEAPGFRRWILSMAGDTEHYRRGEIEALAKNSAMPSTSSSASGAKAE